jgi:AcrR family transcriptional regulator
VESPPTVRQRKRGQELESAIFDAVLAELAEVGYGGLSMEGIAARARTAKSSLYRRWSSLEDVVIAAVESDFPDPHDFPHTGDLRGELTAVFRQMADLLAGSPGRATTAIIGGRSPRLHELLNEKILDPRIRRTEAIFERAAERGEIPASAVTELTAGAGSAIICFLCLMRGRRLTDAEIESIIDRIVLPAVGYRSAVR